MIGPPTTRSVVLSLIFIAACVATGAGAFAFTAGWLSPDRLTASKMVEALAPPTGAYVGFRRNHSKGICFTGVFKSNGAGAALSRASALATGEYPVVGRFNLGTNDPYVADSEVLVRGMGLQITTPDGAVWRAAMINLPFFPVATIPEFYGLLQAQKSKEPDAMKNFVAAHAEFAHFAGWAGSATWSASFAETPYNSINAFVFTDASGTGRTVRWSLRPAAPVVPTTPDDLAKLGPNHLEDEIATRVAAAPQTWTLAVTVAAPGDPTDDPSQAWPEGRQTVDVGALVVTTITSENEGACRNINFDPTILPDGMSVSDDPFPAARSAAYARSYALRTAESEHFPEDYLKAPETPKQ